MHHDPLFSSKAVKVFSWGHDWVVLALLVQLPRWAPTKVFALPLLFRLYVNRQGLTKGRQGQAKTAGLWQRGAGRQKKKWRRPTEPNHRTRPELLVAMLQMLAGWFPHRQFVVGADSGYAGQSVLRHLPANVDLISQVHPQGVLYAPPPPPSGNGDDRRKKGERLPGLQAWADDSASSWQQLAFDQYGLHATLQVKVQQALYYTAGKDRLLTVILTRDTKGKRPDHRFYCTRLDWNAREVLSAYASRWALEVTFEGAKQVLGLEDPANRSPRPCAAQRRWPGTVQSNRAVVRHGGSPVAADSGAAVVSAEARTIVSGHGDDVAAEKLGRETSGGGVTVRPSRKMVGGRGRVGGPGRLTQHLPPPRPGKPPRAEQTASTKRGGTRPCRLRNVRNSN